MNRSSIALQFRLDDLSDPRIAAFIEEHLTDMRAASPPESVFALDLEGLRQPDVRFWSAWAQDGRLLAGTGALKRIDGTHGEIKSMRSAKPLRGQGVGSAILSHLVAQARASGWERLSLETGSQPFFAPARALYARHGFTACAAFEGYSDDPTSHFMTLRL